MSAYRQSLGRRFPLALLVLMLIGLGACASGPRLATLSAEVVPTEPLALPPEAELIVRLVEVAPAANEAGVIAESTYTRLGRGPIPVVLRYAAGAIEPGHAYALSARIRSNGETTHASTSRVAVLTGDVPSDDVIVPIEAVRPR